MDIARTIPSRSSDPETSHKAEKSVRVRAGSQRAVLLAAYAEMPFPLIDEEAAITAGVNPRSCWWKRCSELREGGYIEWAVINGVPYEKKSSVNEWCKASVLTDKGRQALKELSA